MHSIFVIDRDKIHFLSDDMLTYLTETGEFGRKDEKTYVINTNVHLNVNSHEKMMFNNFMRLCQERGYTQILINETRL